MERAKCNQGFESGSYDVAEVRSQTYADGWTVHRIFVRGHDFPGLAMARTLGDASVKEHGVTADPEVSEVTVDLSQSPFMILASDGVRCHCDASVALSWFPC